jgi:hypothetical protein
LTFSVRINNFLSNNVVLQANISTQPQSFGVRNEKENPKGANMKPPEEDSVIPFLEAFLVPSFINPKVFNQKGSGIPNKGVRR